MKVFCFDFCECIESNSDENRHRTEVAVLLSLSIDKINSRKNYLKIYNNCRKYVIIMRRRFSNYIILIK